MTTKTKQAKNKQAKPKQEKSKQPELEAAELEAAEIDAIDDLEDVEEREPVDESELAIIKPHRRRKMDKLRKLFMWVSFICWGLFVVAMIFVSQATPETHTVFSRHLELEINEKWDEDAVLKAINIMYYIAGFSFVALVLKALRHRRKADRYPISIVMLLLVSLLGAYLLTGKLTVE
ncbi:MAG: hypothetical protein HQL71_12580 [Magnetococcales bacterium]|nr:hypothetical protein [Magnetococcales bacterium]